MSRIGLSIDSSSEGSASDLSDYYSEEESFSLWAKPVPDLAFPPRGVSLSLDATDMTIPLHMSELSDYSSIEIDENNSMELYLDDCPAEGPPTFRSRIHRRLEQLQQQYNNEDIEEEDQMFRCRNPRVFRFRFYLILVATTLVIMSLTRVDGRPPMMDTIIRREEVVFPLHQEAQKQKPQRIVPAQLPRYYLPKQDNTQPSSSIRGKIRPNLAMARSQESRPVFGQVLGETTLNVERISLGGDKKQYHFYPPKPPQATFTLWLSWWPAALAVIFKLVETSYRNSRRTEIEAERRL